MTFPMLENRALLKSSYFLKLKSDTLVISNQAPEITNQNDRCQYVKSKIEIQANHWIYYRIYYNFIKILRAKKYGYHFCNQRQNLIGPMSHQILLRR